MTWQRIDENTYIDDTLITCAEYQLFIDEMREQGKYYQPDHWTSYQFSVGEARKPILGVRQSDATAFCEWLIEGEGREWKFRLPTQEEAKTFPIKNIGISPLGYWIDVVYQIAWVGLIPKSARGRDGYLVARLEKVLNLDIALGPAISRARIHARDRALARARARALDLDLVQTTDPELARELDRVRTFDRNRTNVFWFVYDRTLHRDSDRNLDQVLDIFIDIFTLQERIEGSSPALRGDTPRQGAETMTWQRIDENTYIDDTLVTCAEYQLFIDEMREQGKYYQPDHWKSYQFPEGKAHDPILGVRYDDAKAFCKWLTRKNKINGLIYRPPDFLSETDYPIGLDGYIQHIGYWCDKLNIRPTGYQGWMADKIPVAGFRWIGNIPANPRSVDRDQIFGSEIRQKDQSENIYSTDRKDKTKNFLTFILEHYDDIMSIIKPYLDLDSVNASVNEINLLTKKVGGMIIGQAEGRMLEIHFQKKSRFRGPKKGFISPLSLSINNLPSNFFELDKDLLSNLAKLEKNIFDIKKNYYVTTSRDRKFDCDHSCTLAYLIGISLKSIPTIIDIIALYKQKDIVFTEINGNKYTKYKNQNVIVGLERIRNYMFDFLYDIFTLQERIAGRSPAFEGIRLVKERIR